MTMMTKLSTIITIFLFVIAMQTNAQTTFAAVKSKTGFIKLENDSIVLTPAEGIRGIAQWQSSFDLITWVDEASNLPNAVLAFKPKYTKFYRLKTTEGKCSPLYSDTIKVFAMSTKPADYILAGIPAADLVSAGVELSTLLPVVITSAVSSVTSANANVQGNVTSEGSLPVSARGVCWSTGSFPTVNNDKTSEGVGLGTFTSIITGLKGSTTYYVRAYATNLAGITYGAEKTYTTLAPVPPVVATSDLSNIGLTTATGGGYITSDGGTPVTARGICWNTTGSPTTANNKTTDGSGYGTFTSSINSLIGGTTYYVRAYATNAVGTTYGTEKTFATLAPIAPAITTTDISAITQTNATSGGSVTYDGGSPVTSRGVCWNTAGSPTITNSKTTDGSGFGAFTSNITSLTASTTYYARAYATNAVGTSYGAEKTFTTLLTTQIVDIDGNVYDMLTIGAQIWLKQNLKVTKYRNGDVIGTTTPAILNISSESTPKYQWAYDGNESNVSTYGRLYTWYAVTDSRNVCPTGWHVPTDAEWTTLTNYLTNNGYGYGGSGNDIGKSVASTSGWTTYATAGTVGNDQASNNSSGFSALPCGVRSENMFRYVGESGGWWSSTEASVTNAYLRGMNYSISNVNRISNNKFLGEAVRCIKDN
jgi:uncharacterized protein (TIGR02145 family)